MFLTVDYSLWLFDSYSEIWVNIADQAAQLPPDGSWVGVQKDLEEQFKTKYFKICLLFKKSYISVNLIQCACL